ncbi:hypothetical protein ILYODFUR_025078 [Ilyodon furcidens]|uniref:Secreted protein n=1 Tax=Ilyodon furcidens TaxID=33524 RepID=A0ABV0UW91_9TELE
MCLLCLLVFVLNEFISQDITFYSEKYSTWILTFFHSGPSSTSAFPCRFFHQLPTKHPGQAISLNNLSSFQHCSHSLSPPRPSGLLQPLAPSAKVRTRILPITYLPSKDVF